MKGLLALAVGIGLATVAGAQQQKGATDASLLSRSAHNKGVPTSLPVISKTENARSTTLVFDISGQDSWDGLFDTSNTVLTVPLATGQLMTGIGWDVNIATVGASWLSEAVVYFDGSDRDAYGLFLTPGFADTTPGTGSYSSAVIDLTDNGIPDIPILADGLLYIELFEGFDDVPDAIDANWLAPSTLTIVYDDPPAPRCSIWTEDFDSGTFPPAGWTVLDNTGSGGWDTNTFYGRGNSTPGSGECAAIDSDFLGSGVIVDTELWSAPFDLPAEPCSIEYATDINYLFSETLNFDISTDGGATWTTLETYVADFVGIESVDLSAYAGTTGVIIRFQYISGWDWWWLVDNVSLVYNATAANRNGVVPNPDSYTATLPILDEDWTATIDVGSTGHALGELFAYAGPDSFSLGPDRTILVNPAGGELAQLDPVAGPIATYTLTVPADCALFGLTLSTQAVHFGGAPWVLSNAQDLTFGY